MEVTLYSYNGRSDAINKLSSAVEKYSGNVRTYGTVTQLNMRFELSRLYNANYAAYEFNGRTFYGFLDIVSTAEGVYIYQIIVDALTTAYYNGCMNQDILVKYSAEGTELFEDSRIPLVGTSERITYPIYPWNNNSYIVMIVLSADNSSTKQAVTGYKIYLFTNTQWREFATSFSSKLSEAEQGYYGQSILSVYAVHSFGYTGGPPGIWSNSSVELVAVNTMCMSSTLSNPPVAYQKKLIDVDCKVYSGDITYQILEVDSDYFVSSDNGLNYAIYNSNSFLYIPYIGIINFKFSDLFEPSDFGNCAVGAKIYINYISATLNASLYTKINGVIHDYPEFSISASITEEIPLAIDTSKQEWFKSLQMGKQVAGQLLSFDIAGVLGTLQEAAYIDKHGQIGSWDIIGGYGGNISRTRDEYPILKIVYSMPEDFDAYRENFGAPDHKPRNISSLKGYIMTERARLPYNGLPGEIIKQAEIDLDGGVWML